MESHACRRALPLRGHESWETVARLSDPVRRIRGSTHIPCVLQTEGGVARVEVAMRRRDEEREAEEGSTFKIHF